jgi:hypothetical protein
MVCAHYYINLSSLFPEERQESSGSKSCFCDLLLGALQCNTYLPKCYQTEYKEIFSQEIWPDHLAFVHLYHINCLLAVRTFCFLLLV